MEKPVQSALAETFVPVSGLLPVLGSVERVCTAHGPYTAATYHIAGRDVVQHCPRCLEAAAREETAQRIDAARQAANRSRVESLFKQAAIPEHFADASFETCRPNPLLGNVHEQREAYSTCFAYATNFKLVRRDGGNLLLTGESGTGKTTIACAIANHLIKEGYRCLFVEASTIVSRLHAASSFSSTVSQEEILHELAVLDLLIIDEIEEIEGELARSLMNKVINVRYSYRKPPPPVIAITNLPPAQLTEKLSVKAIDRLAHNSRHLPFKWMTHRAPPPGVDPVPSWMLPQ